MLEAGDEAPEFTAPMATPEAAAETDRGSYTADDVAEYDLVEDLQDGPAVFAFYPGVYSRTCTQELCEFRDWMQDLGDLTGSVYGVSVDTPWSLLAFVDEYDIAYPLLSGFNNTVVRDFGVRWNEGVLAGIAVRSVFVVTLEDGRPTVTYAWTASEDAWMPDLETLEEELEAAA